MILNNFKDTGWRAAASALRIGLFVFGYQKTQTHTLQRHANVVTTLLKLRRPALPS
jgi:hypothetical protein